MTIRNLIGISKEIRNFSPLTIQSFHCPRFQGCSFWKLLLRTENEFFVAWGENGFDLVPFWKVLSDYANQEIGVPGNRFLPTKMGVSWEGGRLARL